MRVARFSLNLASSSKLCINLLQKSDSKPISVQRCCSHLFDYFTILQFPRSTPATLLMIIDNQDLHFPKSRFSKIKISQSQDFSKSRFSKVKIFQRQDFPKYRFFQSQDFPKYRFSQIKIFQSLDFSKIKIIQNLDFPKSRFSKSKNFQNLYFPKYKVPKIKIFQNQNLH